MSVSDKKEEAGQGARAERKRRRQYRKHNGPEVKYVPVLAMHILPELFTILFLKIYKNFMLLPHVKFYFESFVLSF